MEHHRVVVDRALDRLGLGWDAWPDVVANEVFSGVERLSALILLLAAIPEAERPGIRAIRIDPEDDSLDWLGRQRHPWQRISRLRYPWSPDTARLAVTAVTRRDAYDDRRVAIALRGAALVCDSGEADAALLDALRECTEWLDQVPSEEWRVGEMRNLARRGIAAATPPQLLDLSLLVEGDAWAGPARAAAQRLPDNDIAPLVRRLGALGPRRPSKAWLKATEEALEPPAARDMLTRWVALAANAPVVPELPGKRIGDVPGTLFAPGNLDIVRAATVATRFLHDYPRIPDLLGVLARRGSAHNGMPAIPEALALKVAFAAVDSLVARKTPVDIAVLKQLRGDVARRDLARRVRTALDQHP